MPWFSEAADQGHATRVVSRMESGGGHESQRRATVKQTELSTAREKQERSIHTDTKQEAVLCNYPQSSTASCKQLHPLSPCPNGGAGLRKLNRQRGTKGSHGPDSPRT